MGRSSTGGRWHSSDDRGDITCWVNLEELQQGGPAGKGAGHTGGSSSRGSSSSSSTIEPHSAVGLSSSSRSGDDAGVDKHEAGVSNDGSSRGRSQGASSSSGKMGSPKGGDSSSSSRRSYPQLTTCLSMLMDLRPQLQAMG